MNINAISESIKELLAEQNHDVTNITIRSMMNRIIALNSIVIQFVKEANKDEALSTELGVANNEVLQLHQFAEYIARLDDTDFNTNLDECKLVSRVQLIHTLNAIEGLLGKAENVVDKARGFTDKVNLDSLSNVSLFNKKNRFCD